MNNTELDLEIARKTRLQFKRLTEFYEWCAINNLDVILKYGPVFLN